MLEFGRLAWPLLSQAGDYETKPSSAYLLAVAVFPAIVGGALFFWLMKKEYEGWSKNFKYLAILVPVLGALIGFRHFSDVQLMSYRQFHYLDDRHVSLHQAAFVVPLITIVGMIVWAAIRFRQEKLDM